MRTAAANAANALRNQNTVVFVELDDVSHCSKGYKVHQRIQTRLSLSVKDAVFAKERTQGEQHIVDDADACEIFRREGRAR